MKDKEGVIRYLGGNIVCDSSGHDFDSRIAVFASPSAELDSLLTNHGVFNRDGFLLIVFFLKNGRVVAAVGRRMDLAPPLTLVKLVMSGETPGEASQLPLEEIYLGAVSRTGVAGEDRGWRFYVSIAQNKILQFSNCAA